MKEILQYLKNARDGIVNLVKPFKLTFLTAVIFILIVAVVALVGMVAINILFEYFGWKEMPYKVAVVFTAIGFGVNEVLNSRRNDE